MWYPKTLMLLFGLKLKKACSNQIVEQREMGLTWIRIDWEEPN